MSDPIPVPEWCKPGATAYVETSHGAYYQVQIAKVTPTQVVVDKTSDGAVWRFSLKHELREVSSLSVYHRARLVAPDDPTMLRRKAESAARRARQEAAKKAWPLVDEWVRRGSPDNLDAAIRILTEEASR